MRKIIRISDAMTAHMPGLKTWRALPVPGISQLDPYIFLNHHGYEEFPANNQGLPFGPHPHRGFETLTFIVEGELVHQDSQGFSSRILKGGVQWMTAGAGIIHSETSSDEFLEKGGPMEILQLWINLPAAQKMSPAHYQGFQKDEIPELQVGEGFKLNLICGAYDGAEGPVQSPYPQFMSTLEAPAESKLQWDSKSEQLFFYLVKGSIKVNGQEMNKRQLAQFENKPGSLDIEVRDDAYIILGEAEPIKEPVVSYGPFVMNSEAEIQQAIMDYQSGKMGRWTES